MAYEFYVTIEGKQQGAFKGESLRETGKDKLTGLSFNHTITAPRDQQTGRASGSRQHGAITFSKEWGAATPQIFQAMVTNEVLPSVLFEFFHSNEEGELEVYHTINLTNATVSKVDYSTGGGSVGGESSARGSSTHDTHEIETVSFSYERIEHKNVIESIVAEDNYRAR